MVKMKMMLFILHRRRGSKYRWPLYGTMLEVVVRAESIGQARQLAAKKDNGCADAWLQHKHTVCQQIHVGGPAEVIGGAWQEFKVVADE